MGCVPSLDGAASMTFLLPILKTWRFFSWPGRNRGNALQPTCGNVLWPLPWWPLAQRVRKRGHGFSSGKKTVKSTSLIGYHLPFPYPHPCNWHIDQLAPLHIVSSTLTCLHWMEWSTKAAPRDTWERNLCRSFAVVIPPRLFCLPRHRSPNHGGESKRAKINWWSVALLRMITVV